MVIFRLRLWTTFEILNRPVPVATSVCGAKSLDTLVSAYRAENSGIWALWLDQDWTVVSKFVRPPPFAKALFFNLISVRDIFISRFHELEIIYKGVFLPVGPAMRRVSGHLMGIWKNKTSGNDGCQ
jgi:hypothetical protein